MARPKKETQNTNETTTDTQFPRRMLTPEEQAILARVESEDTSWMTIREDELTDFSLSADPLRLPPFAEKLLKDKKYAFRWCERKGSRVDELCRAAQPPLRWAIVNRQTLPESAANVDDILGCVCCLDQMLLFKPYAHHQMVLREKRNIAENRDKGSGTEAWKQRNDEGYIFGAAESKIGAPNPFKISSNDVIMATEEAAFGEETGDLVIEGEE